MIKVVDCHTHLGRFNVSGSDVLGWLDVGPENLLKYVEKCNLSKVWLLSHPPIEGLYDLSGSYEALELAKSYPEIRPFCQVDNTETLAKYVDRGCVGIGEIKVPLPINDPKLLTVFRAAKDYGLPVVVHTTDKHCYELSSAMLGEALQTQANIVLHGWGVWNRLGDGSLVHLMKDFPNLYVDISANSGFKSLGKNVEYSRFVLEWYSSRVLYGTDFPMLTTYGGSQFGVNQDHYNFLNRLSLSQDALHAILHGNAERLVK